MLLSSSNLMQSNESFEVIVRRKMPYVTSFLFYAFLFFGVILFIIDFFFLPVRKAPGEIQVGYYILVIPEFIKKAMLISIIGLGVTFPLFIHFRLYKNAILTFYFDRIEMNGKNIDINIPIATISRIYCMDSETMNGESRDKLTIYFQQKRKIITRVRLKHYVQTEYFMERLIQYQNIDFKMYDFDVSPDPIKEG